MLSPCFLGQKSSIICGFVVTNTLIWGGGGLLKKSESHKKKNSDARCVIFIIALTMVVATF